MIELRPYQADVADALRAAYKSGRRAPILVLSTGSGKTVIFAHITQGAAERGNRTLILAHRRELITQASKKLIAFGVKHAVCMPGYGACSRDLVVVGSVQTVVRRLPQLGQFRLIVIDECVSGDAVIETEIGPLRLRDPANAKYVLSYDGTKTTWKRITRWWKSGTRKTKALTLSNGAILRLTAEHPVLTQRGWCQVKDLTMRDTLLVTANAGVAQLRPLSFSTCQPICTTNWVAINKIEDCSEEGVFDLSVEDTHCFFANGILVHNCHHATAGSYRTILAAQPQAKLLGVTATPCRLDYAGLGAYCGGFFDSIIEGPSMADLIAQGYLAPLVVYAPPVSMGQVKLRKRAGEFAAEDDAALMDKPTITGDAIGHYRRYADGQQAIAFCCTVLHAKHVAEAFAAAGIASESIDGGMKTFERDAALRRFAAGQTRVLTSCDLVSEGFDCPSASVAIMLRHTASLTVYRQQAGRICRPEPGKTALILDHVGNTQRHGLPDEDITWSLDGKPKRKTETLAGGDPWQCRTCYRICYPAEKICPDCGTPKPRQERELPKVTAGELALVQKPWEKIGLSYEEYQAVVINRENARVKEDREYFTRVARAKGYKDGWIYHRVVTRHEARLKAAMTGQAQLLDCGREAD